MRLLVFRSVELEPNIRSSFKNILLWIQKHHHSVPGPRILSGFTVLAIHWYPFIQQSGVALEPSSFRAKI